MSLFHVAVDAPVNKDSAPPRPPPGVSGAARGLTPPLSAAAGYHAAERWSRPLGRSCVAGAQACNRRWVLAGSFCTCVWIAFFVCAAVFSRGEENQFTDDDGKNAAIIQSGLQVFLPLGLVFFLATVAMMVVRDWAARRLACCTGTTLHVSAFVSGVRAQLVLTV